MINAVLHGKRVLIREDLNVPMEGDKILDDQRIKAALPTIQYALEQHARVSVVAHLGRPKKSGDPQYSLAPVAQRLAHYLGYPVHLINHWQQHPGATWGAVDLWENVRFHPEETNNDPVFAQTMAARCDVFIMDAFASAHREHASTCGIIPFATEALAGPLLSSEIRKITHALAKPMNPTVAVVGGKKISTKIHLLESLMHRVDHMIVGGGIANTLLKAAGYPIGISLYEPDCLDMAQSLMDLAQQNGVNLPLPQDVVVALTPDVHGPCAQRNIKDVRSTDKILDLGPQTTHDHAQCIKNAARILWNGPVGLFEVPAYATGTQVIGKAIAESNAFSIAGGGDTLSAIAQLGINHAISLTSTGGGAFLALLTGKTLPTMAALREKNGT